MNSFPAVFESIDDLDITQLQYLLLYSQKLKQNSVPLGMQQFSTSTRPIVATSFLENSTRTKHSFAIAVQKLGAMYLDFAAETSSLKKGESLAETLLTLKYQGVDVCVIRTSVSHELRPFKLQPPIKIINGGDGINEHPTQALLDLFTMQEIGFAVAGKTIAIIGDCVHSRVGHSLMKLLPLFGAKILLCGPLEYLPKKTAAGVSLTDSLAEALEKSDLLYLLRIQKERHGSEQSQKHSSIYHQYHDHYGMNLNRLKQCSREIPVFHPGPANIGVEISHDLMKSAYYQGYQQVVNSIYMRMAIIKSMIDH